MAYLAGVQKLMVDRAPDYSAILNNMRGEAILLPLARQLKKPTITVLHLNVFDELAHVLREYNAPVISISNAQRTQFPDLNYIATIYNPVNTTLFSFNEKLELYRNASVFVFPISWNEPFGLVMIEALSCGTPVVAYPHGGPKEIVKNGVNGFLVNNVFQMQDKKLP